MFVVLFTNSWEESLIRPILKWIEAGVELQLTSP